MDGAKQDASEEKVMRELWAGKSDETNNSGKSGSEKNSEENHAEPVKTEPRLPPCQLSEMTSSDLFPDDKPVVCICNENIPSVAIDKLNERYHTVVLYSSDSRQVMMKKLRGVQGLFMYGHSFKLNALTLNIIGDTLKVVGLMSDNFDNVNVRELTWRRVKIGSARCEVVDSVAETAIGLALTVCHRLKSAYTSVIGSRASWEDGVYNKTMMSGKCGIVGSGDVGMAIARRLVSFGVADISYSVHQRNRTESYGTQNFVNFDLLLRESDFIFVVCPITEKTKNLFDYKAFSRMKRTCVFVSVSSWGIINMQDMTRALKERLIWGVGLDLPESVQMEKVNSLLNLDNCFVTPHMSTSTERTREKMALVTAENIICGIQGTQMPCQVCFKVEHGPSMLQRLSKSKQMPPKIYPTIVIL